MHKQRARATNEKIPGDDGGRRKSQKNGRVKPVTATRAKSKTASAKAKSKTASAKAKSKTASAKAKSKTASTETGRDHRASARNRAHKANPAIPTEASPGKPNSGGAPIAARFVPLVDATTLHEWSSRVGSRTSLATLVADLVRASASSATAFRFPTGDSAELPGYDGRLQAEEAPPYIPGGASVWEFGTNEQPRDKANKDYASRTKAPLDARCSETTFVFVTSRKWDRAHEWAKTKVTQGPWKDVRALDAVDLEEWLGRHPQVALKWGKELSVIRAEGLQSLDGFWEYYSRKTSPPITEELLLAGREEQVQALLKRLATAGQRITLLADSAEESLAFFVAAVRTADTEIRKYISAKSLIAATEDIAAQVDVKEPIVFAIERIHGNVSDRLLARGHSLLVPLGNDSPDRNVNIRLARASTLQFAHALRKMGLSEEESNRTARECGRSPTILQRRRPSITTTAPAWVRPEAATSLVPAILAGSWDAANENDKRALAKLAGSDSYDFLERQLVGYLSVQDQPIERIGQHWRVISPIDCFELFSRYITSAQMEALRLVAVDVLAELDPALSLPVDERAYAPLHGKVLSHSRLLRDGLAGSILLIAVRGADDRHLTAVDDPVAFANQLVSMLPGLSNDVRLMASLQHQLPLLAEAAPESFLRALEHLLGGKPEAIIPIFSESGVLGPPSPHTGLLWALETLAWSSELLPRVALALSVLARVAPGGKLANHPLASLKNILLPWRPGTYASLRERIDVLDLVLAREPEIGWHLMQELLPEHHSVSWGTRVPRWRDFGSIERPKVTYAELHDAQCELVARAVIAAGSEPNRWSPLLKQLSGIPSKAQEMILSRLATLAADSKLSSNVRFALWTVIREALNRHRAFPNAVWALPPELLLQLGELEGAFRPSDHPSTIRWLFDNWHPNLGIRHDLEQRETEARRVAAIAELVAYGGEEAVLGFARTVRHPELVGMSLPQMNLATIERLAVAAGREVELAPFVAALSDRALKVDAGGWKDIVRRLLESQQVPTEWALAVFRTWSDEPSTWDFVASFGEELSRLYWEKKASLHIEDPSMAEAAVSRYLQVDRAFDATSLLASHAEVVPVELVFTALNAVVSQLNAGTLGPDTMLTHYISELLDALENRQDVNEAQLGRWEYTFLPLLEAVRPPKLLHRLLAKSPQLFVEILQHVFKPNSGQETEPNEMEIRRAEVGWELLHSWKDLPVLDQLSEWILHARQGASDVDRLSVADIQIGRLLAHAPLDETDEAWPDRAVRDVLEQLKSEDIEQGIATERFNMRGVYAKALYEGGKQEWALAEEIRGWAQKARKSPRTARLLERIAANWEAEAKREDISAAQMRSRDE